MKGDSTLRQDPSETVRGELRACPVPDTGVNGFSLGVGLTWAAEVRIAGFLVGGVIDSFLGLVAVGAGIGKQK